MSTPVAVPNDSADRVAPEPPDEAIQQAELAAFWQALADLPRAQREALLLREVRGFSYDQLAEQLALSRPSVRSLLWRARQRLRLRLRDIHLGLGGISWLEALARFFTTGSNPVAPVAAKAAALGLGAAAITGGAVVAPEMLDHHVRPMNVLRATERAARQPPSVHATRQAAASAVSGALGSGDADDWHRESGRSHRVRLRHDRVEANAGPGDIQDGELVAATVHSGHDSGSGSTGDGDLAQPSESGDRSRDGTSTTTDSGSSGRGGSGGGLSTPSGSSDGSNLSSSGDSGSSGSDDGGGGGDSVDSGGSSGSGESGSSGGN
jgi:hypothetical protein